MNKRFLGRTGLSISEIGFGGVEIGMPYGIGVKGTQDMLSEREAIWLLHASFDAGINFYDTARMYGDSERIMGKAFADRRDRVILSTKCRHFRDEEGKLPPDATLKKMIHESMAESLDVLQTDYVDVFMLHQADMEILSNDTIAAELLELKMKGKARAIGASTYRVDETEKVISSGIWDAVQLPFNLLDQRQQEVFAAAEASGVGVVVRSVLLKGLLSNRADDLHPALRTVRDHIKNYDQFQSEDIPGLPTLALKFALSFKEVSTVLVGMDRMAYLTHSLSAANGEYLDGALLQKARALAFPDPAFLDLQHWAKMGWLT